MESLLRAGAELGLALCMAGAGLIALALQHWKRPMIVLVCGGRDFKDDVLMARVLERLHTLHGFTLLVHGASRGADRMAGAWAEGRGILVDSYPVSPEEWGRLGPAAGPIRNQLMLDEAKPALVVAFPGGRGTADMVNRANRRGVPVVDCRQGEPLL